MVRNLFCVVSFCLSWFMVAEEPGPAQAQEATDAVATKDEVATFQLADEVRDAIVPLFGSIAQAEVSRATVEMRAQSKMDGAVVESLVSSYQIASISPDLFTVYLKEPEQRTRIFCNGEEMVVAVASDAFVKLPTPISNQEAVTSLPVPLGPYPEVVLALTLAGVDPAISLLGGMKSLEILDRETFGKDVPAIHLRGVQADEVTWDLWIASDEPPRPLRMDVNLTPMLAASDQLQIPAGYGYELRFDFLSWRVSGEVDKSLFTFKPPQDAKEYKSMEEYFQTMAGVMSEHPLLGKETPNFDGITLSGDPINAEAFADKVIVLDFWATWCAPCVASLPAIKQVTDQYADKGVVFFALNTGEDKEEVEQFLKDRELELDVILDPEGTIASTFVADAIPQTLLIGKDGIIESAHIGFVGEEALKQRLKDELEVLTVGGTIASAESVSGVAIEAGASSNSDTKTDAASSARSPGEKP